MAVKMNGVRNGVGSFDHKVDPFIGGVELDDVRGCGVVGKVFGDLEESWVVPFSLFSMLAMRSI